MGAVVDVPHRGKEQGGHDAVGEHLEHRAADPAHGHGGQAQANQAHVAHRGIADDVFQIGLGQAHEGAIDDAHRGQDGEQRRPVDEPLGAEVHAHPQHAVGPQFHQHPGMDHGHRRGRGHVPHRRPGVEGPQARQHPEAEEEQKEAQILHLRGQPRLGQEH